MPKGIYKHSNRNNNPTEKQLIYWGSKKGKSFSPYPHKPQQGFQFGHKTKWSKKSRLKLSKSTSGENNGMWIKDRSLLKKDPRKDLDTQYKYWRKEIRKRDINVCRLLSNECKGRLETHHIYNWIDYPQLRYVITNGITLCHFHHPRKWEEEKRMIPIFQELLSVSKE